jgi:hypothetical protein
VIIWVSKEATGRPNHQRFEVLGFDVVDHKPSIHVQSCGDGGEYHISPNDIVGFEISEEGRSLTIRTNTKGWST